MNLLDVISQINQEDILFLMKSMFSTYVFYTSLKFNRQNKEKNKFKIHGMPKTFRYGDITLPSKIVNKELKLEEKKVLSKYLGDKLIAFSKTLSDNFNANDLKLFYNNINDLKVKKYSFKNSGTAGDYNPKVNLIRIDKKVEKMNYDNNIYHELFHMASNINTKDRLFCGFYQSNLKENKSIGRGLNEGYTEYMVIKYFINRDFISRSGYWYEIFIVSKLEKIIGKEKMESLYMNANLLGLINELENYNTKEKIMEFIKDLDLYNGRSKLGDLSTTQNRYIIEKHLKNINKFLFTSYLRKIGRQLIDKEINSDDFLKLVQDFSNSFHPAIPDLSVEYNVKYENIFSIDTINEAVEEVFGDTIKLDIEVNRKEELSKEESTVKR